MFSKPCVNDGISTTTNLNWLAGFLNHQQFHVMFAIKIHVFSGSKLRTSMDMCALGEAHVKMNKTSSSHEKKTLMVNCGWLIEILVNYNRSL